jgi:hypothetical protein
MSKLVQIIGQGEAFKRTAKVKQEKSCTFRGSLQKS